MLSTRIVFCLALLIMLSSVTARLATFRPHGGLTSRRFMSMSSTSSARNPVDEFRSLLMDITKVITAAGPRPAITRSIQVAQAVSKLVPEFVQNQKAFQDEKGVLSPARTLRRLFEELGATYIKLGQFVASSPTLFPAEYVLEFQSCLDRSPTVPYSTIRKIIQDDLKRPVSTVYSFIDPVPLASASVAQVHRAKLRDGTEVVIKVRKPGVDSTLEADLGFLFITSRIIEFLNPSLARLSFSNIVGDLRDSMLDELDFTKESRNLQNFRSFLERNNIVDACAPKPFPEATSKRVLTMEYLKGVPLVDLEGIKKYSRNPELTLITALRTWAFSVAENDVFHADVHGGNLLVLEDGRVGFLDFGIVGKISETVWTALSDLLQSFVNSDFRGVANALIRMGATSGKVDEDKFARELEEVVNKIMNIQPEITIQSTSDGSGMAARLTVDEKETTELVLEIVSVAEKNGLKLPREFGLLLKQALYFDRYQKLLAPSLDPLRDSRVRDALNQELSGSGNSVPPRSPASSTKYDPNGEGFRSAGYKGYVIDVDGTVR